MIHLFIHLFIYFRVHYYRIQVTILVVTKCVNLKNHLVYGLSELILNICFSNNNLPVKEELSKPAFRLKNILLETDLNVCA